MQLLSRELIFFASSIEVLVFALKYYYLQNVTKSKQFYCFDRRLKWKMVFIDYCAYGTSIFEQLYSVIAYAHRSKCIRSSNVPWHDFLMFIYDFFLVLYVSTPWSFITLWILVILSFCMMARTRNVNEKCLRKQRISFEWILGVTGRKQKVIKGQ